MNLTIIIAVIYLLEHSSPKIQLHKYVVCSKMTEHYITETLVLIIFAIATLLI